MNDWVVYNGKTIDLRGKMAAIVRGMESVSEFRGLISQPRFTSSPADISSVPRAMSLSGFLTKAAHDRLEFERIQFRDPFLVVYSSGTTCQAKSIVHSVGSVPLNAHKEGRLHNELEPDSVALQYTTTG